LAFLVICSGCTTWAKNISPESVKAIQPNVTTKEQIIATFGTPTRTGLDSGFETWNYTFRKITGKEGWVDRNLYIIFNKDQTVHKYAYGTNKPTMEGSPGAR